MTWQMEAPALRLCERLWPESDQRNPIEILRLAEDTAAIVLDIDGVDYIVTMSPVPIQRARPTHA
jgi:hypothetical protein